MWSIGRYVDFRWICALPGTSRLSAGWAVRADAGTAPSPPVLSWMRFDMIFTLATGLLGLGSFLLPTGAESGLAGEYRSTVRKLDLAAHTEVEL